MNLDSLRDKFILLMEAGRRRNAGSAGSAGNADSFLGLPRGPVKDRKRVAAPAPHNSRFLSIAYGSRRRWSGRMWTDSEVGASKDLFLGLAGVLLFGRNAS
jgi:hypothetical protein